MFEEKDQECDSTFGTEDCWVGPVITEDDIRSDYERDLKNGTTTLSWEEYFENWEY